MQKKLVLAVVLAVIACSLAFSQEAGNTFLVRGRVAPILGWNNYFQGVAGGGQALYNIGGIGIYAGLETYIEYSVPFQCLQLPVELVLGLGKNFWLMAGTTIPLGTQKIGTLEYQMDGFLNTYGLGFRFFTFDIPETNMGIGISSELSYTGRKSVGTGTGVGAAVIDGLTNFFLGIKAYVGVDIDLNL